MVNKILGLNVGYLVLDILLNNLFIIAPERTIKGSFHFIVTLKLLIRRFK